MVKRIIQISDIHIPNDTKGKPYLDMLKKALAQIVKTNSDIDRKEMRIVVCGDVFHNKIKVSNEAKEIFYEFLNYLNSICKTIIFAGNHDMLENNHDRLDSISPVFTIKNVYPNVFFADKFLDYKSGYIQDENIIWALYSMFDNFATPNLTGLRSEYPDKKIIGLFHGEIVGAVTDTGRMSESGVDTDGFSECDAVLAGHIHKYQTIKKNGVPIVYGGSLFQQNAGENISGHGYVVWDVETMDYHLVEVPNDYLIYRFKVTDYDDVANDTEKLLNL